MFEKTKNYIKNNTLNLFYSIIIVLVLLILINVYLKYKQENDFIQGLWVADEDFCQKADIDGMMLYIGPSDGTGITHFNDGWPGLNSTNRKVYLIMYAKDAVIANKKFSIIFAGSIFDYINPFVRDTIYNTLYLIDKDCNDQIGMEDSMEDPSEIHIKKIMPTKLNAKIEISNGKMIWSDDDKVYAEFYKDYTSSGFADKI